MNNINEFIEAISMLKGFADVIRAVEPVNKEILYYENCGINEYKHNCHHFWIDGEACKNCVAMRALINNDTFIKVEYNKEKMFMVSASPIKIGGKKYIVEIIKDITSTGIICDLEKKSVNEMNHEIRKLNNDIFKDELTEIYNKRYIDENLPKAMEQNLEEGTPLSLIMMDIDYFKKVNDVYGHLAGDYIIKELARLLQGTIRKEQDWVARYGGEEFLVVLNNTDKHLAYKIAERMRKAISDKIFEFDEKEIKVTSSFGISSIEDCTKEPRCLIKKADENLYRAKREGRNKTIY